MYSRSSYGESMCSAECADATAADLNAMNCSDCGRKATYKTKKNKSRRARDDHDLCERCWAKIIESIQNEDRKARNKRTK